MVGSEVLVGAVRRLWSCSDKVRIVEESFAAGVTVAALARCNGVAPSRVFGWRGQARSGRSKRARSHLAAGRVARAS